MSRLRLSDLQRCCVQGEKDGNHYVAVEDLIEVLEAEGYLVTLRPVELADTGPEET